MQSAWCITCRVSQIYEIIHPSSRPRQAGILTKLYDVSADYLLGLSVNKKNLSILMGAISDKEESEEIEEKIALLRHFIKNSASTLSQSRKDALIHLLDEMSEL